MVNILIGFIIGFIVGVGITDITALPRRLRNIFIDIACKNKYNLEGKIYAIKLYREFTNKGLKESREYINKLCE